MNIPKASDSSSPTPTPSRKSPLPSSLLSNAQSYYYLESAEEAGGSDGISRNGSKVSAPPHEAWLPITESRNGNALYAAFHTLCSGIGFQALLLPFAFATLGWTWGVLTLALIFAWQLYTMWLLIQLHEPECGMRYSRYLGLSMATFGEKAGKLLALFPTMYLSGGTCVTLIMIGGGTLQTFFQTHNYSVLRLSTVEWYLLFSLSALLLSLFLPNLNSVAKVSLVGAVTAIAYCALILAASIVQGRISTTTVTTSSNKDQQLSHDRVIDRVCSVINSVGIVAFAFRGHNLVLEIQGTMPSSGKTPSKVPMWRGVQLAYLIIALCLFPLAIGGHWAYGYLIPPGNGGMLNALYRFHGRETSKLILGLASLFIVINSLCSFQIYAMPTFDNLELRYVSKTDKPCPWWIRLVLRFFFGCLTCFIAVAFPFLPSLAGLIGGISLPLTLVYPCFMWIATKKPLKYSRGWCLNWGLGILGMVLSVLVVAAAIWTIATKGIEVHFFRPKPW